MDLNTANEYWKKVCDKLKKHPSFPDIVVSSYFTNLSVYYCENRQLILMAPNSYNANHVTQRYGETLAGQCDEVFGIKFDNIRVMTQSDCENYVRSLNNNSLNPRHTFNSFVTGQSNLLAYSAAQKVAETPGTAYNPLFLWGGAGLGKTHLMTAIANYMLETDPSTNVQFFTSEQFTNEVVDAIRFKTTGKLREKLRSADILLIDDVQMLADRNQTQEEFFNTFNHLLSKNKQIVISADKPPESIPTLEERMRSRFKSGVVMRIDKPDFETRIAILMNKALEENYSFEPEAISMLAKAINTNIRELEGALKTCSFMANALTNGDSTVTTSIVKSFLEQSSMPTAIIPKRDPQEIIAAVAARSGVNEADILSKRRNAEIANARHMAIYLVSEILAYSTTRIGQIFGRDHATVMSSIAKAQQLLDEKGAFSDIMEQVKRDLR